jgi:hypothetical protein
MKTEKLDEMPNIFRIRPLMALVGQSLVLLHRYKWTTKSDTNIRIRGGGEFKVQDVFLLKSDYEYGVSDSQTEMSALSRH